MIYRKLLTLLQRAYETVWDEERQRLTNPTGSDIRSFEPADIMIVMTSVLQCQSARGRQPHSTVEAADILFLKERIRSRMTDHLLSPGTSVEGMMLRQKKYFILLEAIDRCFPSLRAPP